MWSVNDGYNYKMESQAVARWSQEKFVDVGTAHICLVDFINNCFCSVGTSKGENCCIIEQMIDSYKIENRKQNKASSQEADTETEILK